ncbi:hypothetical protein [Rubellimicrobium arenae]|uniref:hypothetical protein n=1 Tax=Rubellimicrobium arenae TaxID=2817372 RepID=UPI001B30418C|nr:hypothetical protein [Rubellimicrobium arenae]
MDPIIDALLAWIGENSAYDVAGLPRPAVVLLAPGDLTREYYAAAPQLLPEDGVDDRLLALYSAEDGPDGTLYLLAPRHVPDAGRWDDPTDNPLFREIVLHELVHHVQWQTGAAETWPCPQFGEQEAYTLGGIYLRQVHAADPIPNRGFWARTYSIC